MMMMMSQDLEVHLGMAVWAFPGKDAAFVHGIGLGTGLLYSRDRSLKVLEP